MVFRSLLPLLAAQTALVIPTTTVTADGGYLNVYGNALFSILRIFACTIIIMTRQDNNATIEEFVWVYFCHETVLALVVVQILFDFLPIVFTGGWPPIRTVKNKQPSDVIGEADVPFLDRHSNIIGAP